MTPDQVAVVRRLVTARRALGWRQDIWGHRYHEHLYHQPTPGARLRGEPRLTLEGGVTCYVGTRWVLEYKPPGEAMPTDRLTPESVAEVEEWLRLLGLLPAMAEAAS